ncbi:DUF3307 domain-containing protein [Nocardioides albus]|uniref:DUF3307 domain-containing protein n=1 Tax=Nocardioides albus TaxID=1841 RepID=A0A7W5FBF6_9ACTN|nr:DUF3307 domain-containing protein [Nocardioides albus]MBB3092187.1 hypothetical protein [Nocardioides albus]GGU46453.1 hypothetical protein GCM10007979_52050 [Nocardioides albus]
MFASCFILLYVAHLLADYPLQTDHQARCKSAKSAAGWLANLTHAGTHVIVSALTLGVGSVVLDLELTAPAAAVALAWIGISHAAIDRRRGVLAWMRIARQEAFREHGGAAHVDQTAHIVALALAALALA